MTGRPRCLPFWRACARPARTRSRRISPLELGEDRQQAGHRSTRERGQIQRADLQRNGLLVLGRDASVRPTRNSDGPPCGGVAKKLSRFRLARGPFSGHFRVSPWHGRNLWFPARWEAFYSRRCLGGILARTGFLKGLRVENAPSRWNSRLRIGQFDPIAETSEFPDHSCRPVLLGLFANRWAPFFVTNSLVQD